MSTHVVITGGPGSGKTTLVGALADRGYATVPEAAIQVIAQLNEEIGIEAQQNLRRTDSGAFQNLVLQRQQELEAQHDSQEGLVFLDRGRLDGLAYLRHFGKDPTGEQLRRMLGRDYDHVFLLETLSSFSDRSGSGRMSQRSDSLAIAQEIERVYREHGYEPIRVPEFSIEERVDFVLARIASSAEKPTP